MKVRGLIERQKYLLIRTRMPSSPTEDVGAEAAAALW